MKAHSYSIWLEPEGRLKGKLSEVIDNLSVQCGTPNFSPHVTLLGGIQGTEKNVLDKTSEIAARINPFTTSLSGIIECEDHWTKSMFVVVEKTKALMNANKLAKILFDFEPLERYYPHLSLMYTEDIPIDERQRIKDGLDAPALSYSFDVDKLHLYRTEGAVEDWYKIGEFKLAGE